jgi:phage head maturation protease
MKMALIYKTFPAQSKTIDKENGIYEVMISTESVDRAGDIVRAAGGKFDDYMNNPVVLLGHEYRDLPVAKSLEIAVVSGLGVRAKFQFPEWGLYEKADTTRKLWDAGFLNAASIGFQPIKSANLDPNRPWGPQEYLEWELLEWSIVVVPANQDALRLALDSINTELKRGRVLSAGNEKRLREAADSINQVLSQLEEDPEPDKSQQAAKPNADPTLNNASEAALLKEMEILFNSIREVLL